MPIIPDAVIEDVRARTDIVQVIGDRIPLKRAGAAWKACCPFHNEKTPSFTVNPQRQSWKCFGCGEGGDVFKFLMKHDGMSFVDAVRHLAEKCGVEVVQEKDDGRGARARRLFQVNDAAAAFFQRCLRTTKGAEAARAYLEKRRLGPEIVEAFRLGYDPDAWGALDEFARVNRFTPEEMVAAGLGSLPEGAAPGTAPLRDRFHGRLMFPICDQTGRVVGFSGRILDAARSPAKYVNSPETDVFKKSRVLYALDKAQRHIASSKHREAIVCEGQIDVIRCHACGFPRAVASEGTAFTPEHAQLLHRYADGVVELFDADAAGRKAAVRTAAILLAEGLSVRVARMPPGEDPDSFLLKNPPEAFRKMLDEAVGIVPFHVEYLRAEERDPDAADAASRIVRGVLQTVAACRDPIAKARMLQEVAALTDVPESAVRDELAGVEEALRRQEAAAARRAAAAEPPQVASLMSQVTSLKSQDAGTGAGGPATCDLRPATPTVAPPPDALDVAVCEFLFHHCLEEPGTLNALSRLMPPTLFACDLVRRIVEAFYASVGASTDPVYDLQQADPAVAAFVGSIAAHHDRTGTSENFLAKDVAHDLALRAWRRHLQARIDASKAAQGAALDLDRMRERQQALRLLRALRSWDTGEAVVCDLAGLPAAAEPPSSQDAGPMSQDAGPMSQDAGPMSQDASPMSQDASPMSQDASPMSQDESREAEVPATCDLRPATAPAAAAPPPPDYEDLPPPDL